MILKSGIVDGKELKKILEEPENHIDSQDFFSSGAGFRLRGYFSEFLIYFRFNHIPDKKQDRNRDIPVLIFISLKKTRHLLEWYKGFFIVQEYLFMQ